jgi:hypothetical protein
MSDKKPIGDKKPRSDSKLDSLPEEQFEHLRDMLLANASHRKILQWLKDECGVTVSGSAFTTFYRRHCAPLVRDKRKLAVLKSEDLGEQMAKDPAKWDAAIIDKVKQHVFEFLDLESPKPEDLMLVVDAVTKANKDRRDDGKAQLEREKFEEQRRKAKAADAAKEQIAKLRDPSAGLSASERQAIIDKVDEILGLKS